MSGGGRTDGARVTSTLNDARFDTGRTVYCGPTVISALTGFPASKVEAEIRAVRGEGEASDKLIEGTYGEEVAAALAIFGYRMELKQDFMDLERKARPTVWQWMQKPRNAWAYYILAVHKGKEGHWILIKGVKQCDTYTEGRWTFVCDGPHRGARIMEVHEVKRDLQA